MFRLVIFDFDGTLADSAGWFRRELNGLAVRHRFRQVDGAELETLRGRTNRQIIADLGVARWRLPLIAADMRRRMAADAHLIPLFEGVPAMLEALAGAGLRLAIVSSNAESNVRRILGPDCAARIHDYDCGAGLFGKAARFGKVIRRAGVAPAETLCIGDEVRDIEAARTAGAHAAAVHWGYAAPEGLAQGSPTLTFETMDQIAARLA